ncbi:hypothetical protein D3C72_1145980 [compost metagenome]
MRGMSTGKRLEPISEPWMRFSLRKSLPLSSILTPGAIMPITVAVPPRRSMAKACSVVCFRPMASKA